MLAGLATALPAWRFIEPPRGELYTLHHVSATAAVAAAADDVDLAAWVSHLTSDEYVRCAPQHHGSVQAAVSDGRQVFVSAETIGGNFMVHQYVADVTTRTHVRTVSAASQIWLAKGEPVPMRVTWDVRIEPVSATASRLLCDILVQTADKALAELAAKRPATVPNPVQVHCSFETPRFAADIERKALRGLYRP
jgi:hypothetical protein